VWTLALRGGARVAVVAAKWCDAFGVVTCGRVQLELRDAEPGPVLGRSGPSHASQHTPYARYRMTEERHEQQE
jgi:hypothetical protein